MEFISVTDEFQYKYVFVNILILETYKKSFVYHIFTASKYTFDLIKDQLLQLTFVYADIRVTQIPSFFNYYNLPTLHGNNSWITTTTLDRLVIPFVTDIKKAIYLDNDAFPVSEKVFDLITHDVSNKGIAAVPNNSRITSHILDFSKADFLLSFVKDDFLTFNAGVMLLDFEKIKNNNINEFIIEIYGMGGNRIYINDEVLLNLYDPDYNYLPMSFNTKPYIDHNYSEVNIVHFSGNKSKPWQNNPLCKNNLRKYYHLWKYFYLQLT